MHRRSPSLDLPQIDLAMTGVRKPFALLAASVLLQVCSSVQAADAVDPARLLFTKDAAPPCAICHTLADAGATGAIGPSLDELKPDAQRIAQAVKTGVGQMPAYPQLSDEQVQAIARYVARVTAAK